MQYTVCDISGRHPYHASEQGSSCAANLDGDRLAGITRFPGELPEVSDSSMSGDNIPRLCIRLDVKEDQAPPEKVKQIQDEARHLLNQKKVSALIGKLSAAILAIYPAPLHYRSLQHLKHRALKASSYDIPISISLRHGKTYSCGFNT